MDNVSVKIHQLQKWRARRNQDLSIDSSMNAFCRSLKKANKKLVQMQEAWDDVHGGIYQLMTSNLRERKKSLT